MKNEIDKTKMIIEHNVQNEKLMSDKYDVINRQFGGKRV